MNMIGPAPAGSEGGSPESNRDQLADPIDRAAAAAESLERRWDPDAARSRAASRAARLARINEDRRCAHRAILWAAIHAHATLDGESRSGEQDWIAREQRLIWARERAAGVANVESNYMDTRTVELGRAVLGHMSDAVAAANIGAVADRAAEKATPVQVEEGALQLRDVKRLEAAERLASTRDALAEDMAALQAMRFE